MLHLAMVDKLNRAGFVVAPYNTPEEVPSVKSVSGPARHVGEADKRVRDSRGGSPCGENRCGIGECPGLAETDRPTNCTTLKNTLPTVVSNKAQ